MDDRQIAQILDAVFVQERIGAGPAEAMVPACAAVARWLAARRQGMTRTLIVGLCGAQGSGKSTMAAALAAVLQGCAGLRTAVMSIDDVYLSRAERGRRARDIHPLFATRGVPGTHDVGLAMETIAALAALAPGGSMALPRFSKAEDDVVAAALWPRFVGRPDIILLEGWCVGARPQTDAALAMPVNELERAEDPHAVWRGAVNAALAGAYQALFARLDTLLLLAAPDFRHVLPWRREQEAKLVERVRRGDVDGAAMLDDRALARFVMHYERLTRHILDEMPARADALLALAADRTVLSLTLR